VRESESEGGYMWEREIACFFEESVSSMCVCM